MSRNKLAMILGGAAAWLLSTAAVSAAPLRIVAVGTSNTYGWMIPNQSIYPALLQKMLKAKGIEAEIVNAGILGDTTSGMLGRIDSAVPQGTAIVILEPGPNDRGTKAERAANIEAIRHRLHARSIQVVVYDQKFRRSTGGTASTSRSPAMPDRPIAVAEGDGAGRPQARRGTGHHHRSIANAGHRASAGGCRVECEPCGGRCTTIANSHRASTELSDT